MKKIGEVGAGDPPLKCICELQIIKRLTQITNYNRAGMCKLIWAREWALAAAVHV